MNIGIVTTWFERGASYVSLQYANLLKENNTVFVYARGGYEPNYHNEFNVTVDENHHLIVKSALNIVQFEKWIFDNKITHILFNEQFWWEPILLAKKHKVICSAYVDYYTKETVDLFQIYDNVFCNTKRHFSVFEKFNNAIYLPWGTDCAVFNYSPKPFTERLIFFHSVGWSPFRKGTDLLIEAAFLLDKPFKLIIHTQGNLFELLPNQKAKLLALIEAGKVEIIERTVEAPGLYHLGDVYVYPTRLEGIGLTIAEAISCGLPAIVPNNGPMIEFISDETCKKVAIEKFKMREDNYYWEMSEVSIDDLKKAMEFYIDNKTIINDLAEKTRNFAEINLNWNKNAAQLPNYFKEMKCSAIEENLILKAKSSDKKIMKYSAVYTISPTVYQFLVKVYKQFTKK
jgi:1,2-diacylglycerol 3-alpha-glucosyltransferase